MLINSNYLTLITTLTDACKNDKFLPVLSTKTCNYSERIYSNVLKMCAIWGRLVSLTPWPLSPQLLVEEKSGLAPYPEFEYRDGENHLTYGPNHQSSP